ncbi:hypothetical protein Dimus_006741 [Dionaea muscipula]
MGRVAGDAFLHVHVVVAILLVMWMWCGISSAGAGAVSTPPTCKAERRMLVNACEPVIMRQPPSPLCCERLRVTHVECVCSVITPKLAPLIDVNHAVQVIQSCGRRVPRHFKCGSITTP